MIALLTGRLIAKSPPMILVETSGGVGYELLVPMSTFYLLPAVGGAVCLYTHLLAREEEMQLFGFASEGERDTFRLLIRISGIGPRIALALLSHLTLAELKAVVATQNGQRLTKIPGIGKKTAERLLLELKDQLAKLPWSTAPVSPGDLGHPPSAPTDDAAPQAAPKRDPLSQPDARFLLLRDVTAALAALGYSEPQIAGIVAQLPSDLSLPEAIKWALRQLAGSATR